MTTLAAMMNEKGHIAFASDRRLNYYGDEHYMIKSKFFEHRTETKQPVFLGYSGDWGLIERAEELWGDQGTFVNVYQFVKALRELFPSIATPDQTRPGRLPSWEFTCFWAQERYLYEIDGCLAVSPVAPGRVLTAGSGANFATGAAWSFIEQKYKRPGEPLELATLQLHQMCSIVRHAVDMATIVDTHSSGLWEGSLPI